MAMPSFYLFMEVISYIIESLEGFIMKFNEYLNDINTNFHNYNSKVKKNMSPDGLKE